MLVQSVWLNFYNSRTITNIAVIAGIEKSGVETSRVETSGVETSRIEISLALTYGVEPYKSEV